MTEVWTSELIATLKELWASKLSCAGISDEFGRRHGVLFSRNAVIGKVSRLGLEKRRQVGLPKPKKIKRARFKLVPDNRPAPRPERPSIDDQLIPVEQRRTLLELTDETCRWPVGHVGEPGFFFCGAPPQAHSPYCSGHHAIAYHGVTNLSSAEKEQRRRTAMRNLRLAA